MVKKEKRKIPRGALEPLMEMCKQQSRERDESATNIFKRYLDLMNKYSDYFFSDPWPPKYDHDAAMTFTDEDLDFLYENEDEFSERFETMCLRKNMYLDGFMGYFGMYWTKQAFYKEFIRPELKPTIEAFEKYAQNNENAQDVLNKLKEQFNDLRVIHLSLIDLLETEYPDKAKDLLIAQMLELIHTEEALPPCSEYRCEIQREKLRENQDKGC